MSITNRDLPAGTKLRATYKKVEHTCTVEFGEEGKREYVLADGKRFTSPSAAGTAVMGGSACNGWRFWSVDGAEPAAEAKPAGEKPARKSNSGGRKKKAAGLFRRLPDTNLPEGQHRIWCTACQDGFNSDTETPEICPKGHRADDPELNAEPTAQEQEAAEVTA